MTTAKQFNLDDYLDTYRSLLLSPADWALVREDVFDVVRTAQPTTEAEARGLLAAAGRFLGSMATSGTPSVALLTRENIRNYVEGRRRAGDNVGTLGHVDRRLRILESALVGRPDAVANRALARNTAFDPYSDDELADLARIGAALEQAGDARLTALIRLVEADGLRTADLSAAGMCPSDVTALRRLVRAADRSLQTYRLRHRWLLRQVTGPLSVAALMTRQGLNRGDLETVLPALDPTEIGTTVIRSA